MSYAEFPTDKEIISNNTKIHLEHIKLENKFIDSLTTPGAVGIGTTNPTNTPIILNEKPRKRIFARPPTGKSPVDLARERQSNSPIPVLIGLLAILTILAGIGLYVGGLYG